MKSNLLALLLFVFITHPAFCQTTVIGKITDKISGKPLSGAHVILPKINLATTTNTEGKFTLSNPGAGMYKIEISFVGYESIRHTIDVQDDSFTEINFPLTPTIYSSDEVVITASRNTEAIKGIPARINVITKNEIENIPNAKIEDILKYATGVNVNSPGGMYSMRPVITLRGLSGDEQGRTLVLMDGIPLNKGDTGDVNWAGLNTDDIERIEVFHGPGSSIYGNNAMGGVINIITRKPTEKIEGSARISYGTFNTLMTGANVGGNYKNGMYFRISTMYNTSDGYNDLPAEFREDPDYSVPRFLDEHNLSTKAGWRIDPMLNVEFQYEHYRNKKGEGEKIEAPDGEYRHFDNDLLNARLNGSNGKFSYNLNVFYQYENYFKLDERMQGGSYSRFDVMSDRIDKGAVLNLSGRLSKTNKLAYGAEARFGSVDGGDFYITSPDSVVNKGKLDNYAFFIQDQQSFLVDRLNLTFGFRYDNARFHDGDYFSTDGSWTGYLPELKDHTWNALSPRIGLSYRTENNNKYYISWSRGFRASILDDLCRSGWMWVGPKIANPNLGPETIDNLEIGGDISLIENLKIASSVFYAQGRDFLYYVATGDSLWGKRPIFQRQNITGVSVFGFEVQTSFQINPQLNIFGNYIFNHSEIGQFDKNPDLEGKILKYTPAHQAKAGIIWNNKIISISLASLFKSKQFTSDDNSKYIDPFITFDGKISKTLVDKMTAFLEVSDIFDNQHCDSEYYLSPGRRINIGLSITF
ncbi:MAG: TonB-dependent receptor [Bacteroidales bacterium]|nr:TonB-dependent receptor [Bacteroidales bacterium]